MNGRPCFPQSRYAQQNLPQALTFMSTPRICLGALEVIRKLNQILLDPALTPPPGRRPSKATHRSQPLEDYLSPRTRASSLNVPNFQLLRKFQFFRFSTGLLSSRLALQVAHSYGQPLIKIRQSDMRPPAGNKNKGKSNAISYWRKQDILHP